MPVTSTVELSGGPGLGARPRGLAGLVAPGLVVGVAGALVGLDRAPLWRDEAYSLGAVHQLGPTLRSTSGTMALYYAVLRAWTTVSESVWWMRALSVALATVALALVVVLATRLVGPRAARWAGVLLALSPLWVRYAQEARSYALVMAMVAGSWLALDQALARTEAGGRATPWWALHTLLGALLPLAHGLAVLQLLAQPAALLVGRADRRAWRGLLPGTGAAVAVTAGLAAVGASEVGDWVVPLSTDQVRTLATALTADAPVLAVLLLAVAGVGGAVAAGRVRDAAPGLDRVRAAMPLAWAVLPPLALVAVSVVRPSLVPRYVAASAPGVALLLALACPRIEARLRLGLPLATAVVVAALLAGQVAFHTTPPAVDWRAAARTVATRSEPGDELLLAESAIRPVFEAAWRDVPEAPALPVANGARPLGRVLRVDPRLSDEASWAAAADAPRLWLVGEVGTAALAGALAALATDGRHHRVATWDVEAGVAVHLLALDPGTRP